MRWGDGAAGSAQGSFMLPVGTVTLLLADLEGSVRAWERGPSAMTVAVAELEALVSETVAAAGGVRPVEQGEGDSFVAAFARASDAVAVAVELQQRLPNLAWPPQAPPSMRMAIHSGEVQLRDEGNYIGGVINRCARLRALAHGGQVLVSAVAHDLVVDTLPPDTSLIDLGSHRLRDLARPEHVYQLEHPGLRTDFPALRSLDMVPNNLPVRLTSFVGRGPEMTEVHALLAEHRLVTLLGSGGCGKTRLALQVAADQLDRNPSGVWFVDLAPANEAESAARSLAAVLGLRELPYEQLVDTIARSIGDSQTLLVLDNCEHLVAACAELIEALLTRCPNVTVLATSREVLGVDSEIRWRVPSLTVPASTAAHTVDAVTQSDAVRLFIDRAVQVRPDFTVTNDNAPAVAEICHRLDGIPLAIELAAARVRVLAPDEIAQALTDRFRLLTGGGRTSLPRQQTLEASVDWSYRLLTAGEQAVLRRLSVFAGGLTIEAAEAVCTGGDVDEGQVLDLLTALVDKSLLAVDGSGRSTRFAVLETVRMYAAQKLADDAEESGAARAAHLGYLVEFAERLTPHLDGPDPTEWVRVLDRDLDNLRTAHAWALATADADSALRLTGALRRFWWLRLQQEGFERLAAALSLDGGRTEHRIRALATICLICAGSLDVASGERYGTEAIRLARAHGDDALLAETLSWAGWGALANRSTSHPWLVESMEIAQRIGDDVVFTDAALAAAMSEISAGSPLVALDLAARAQAATARSGSAMQTGHAAFYRGLASYCCGSFEDGRRCSERALEILEPLDDVLYTFLSLVGIGFNAAWSGDLDTGHRRMTQAHELVTRVANHVIAATSDGWLALIDYLDGDAGVAARLEAAVPFFELVCGWGAPQLLDACADLARRSGDLAAGRRHAEHAVSLAEAIGSEFARCNAFVALARQLLAEGDFDAAESVAHDALTAAEVAGVVFATVDALEVLARRFEAVRNDADAARLWGAVASARAALGYPCPPVRLHQMPDITDGSAFANGAAMSLADAVAWVRRGRGKRGRAAIGWGSLTPAERQVVDLVAEGLTNPQIAERLFVARSTVKGHVSSALAKLGLTSRTELAVLAARRRSP